VTGIAQPSQRQGLDLQLTQAHAQLSQSNQTRTIDRTIAIASQFGAENGWRGDVRVQPPNRGGVFAECRKCDVYETISECRRERMAGEGQTTQTVPLEIDMHAHSTTSVGFQNE
jgi:hypothetical protein